MPLKVRFYHSYVRIIAQCSSRFRLISGGLTENDENKRKIMKILITGVHGFVGSNLVEALKKEPTHEASAEAKLISKQRASLH